MVAGVVRYSSAGRPLVQACYTGGEYCLDFPAGGAHLKTSHSNNARFKSHHAGYEVLYRPMRCVRLLDSIHYRRLYNSTSKDSGCVADAPPRPATFTYMEGPAWPAAASREISYSPWHSCVPDADIRPPDENASGELVAYDWYPSCLETAQQPDSV